MTSTNSRGGHAGFAARPIRRDGPSLRRFLITVAYLNVRCYPHVPHSENDSMPLTRSLQEVVLAIHFAGPIPLTVVDLAAWIEDYGGTTPRVTELPALPQSQMPQIGGGAQIGMGMMGVQLVPQDAAALPRVRVSGADGHKIYLLQNDRVAFGWDRNVEVGEESEYLGYEALQSTWHSEIDRFSAWLEGRFAVPLTARLVELSYNNAYSVVADGKTRRLADILRFLNADFRPVNAFNAVWAEVLDTPNRAIVNAQVGMGTTPPGQRVVGVHYLGLAALDPLPLAETPAAIIQNADRLHARILDMHRAAVVTGT